MQGGTGDYLLAGGTHGSIIGLRCKMIIASELLLAATSDLLQLMQVRPNCAYIDPGMGSLIFQVLLGTMLASFVAIKVYWRQLKVFVGGLIGRKSDSAEAAVTEEANAAKERQDGDSGV